MNSLRVMLKFNYLLTQCILNGNLEFTGKIFLKEGSKT